MATYNEVMAAIAASSREDWLKNHDETHATYKGDLNIRLANTTEEVLGGDVELREPWAERVSLHPPVRTVFTIYYANSYVEDVYTVAVDGFRAYIPYPKSVEDLVITRWQYNFAKIIQPPYDRLDYYLSRAGIRVE